MKRCIAMLLATLLLAGCGAAGGLYLPDQPRQHEGPLHKDPRKSEGQAAPQSAAPADGAPAAPATPPPTNQP